MTTRVAFDCLGHKDILVQMLSHIIQDRESRLVAIYLYRPLDHRKAYGLSLDLRTQVPNRWVKTLSVTATTVTTTILQVAEQ